MTGEVSCAWSTQGWKLEHACDRFVTEVVQTNSLTQPVNLRKREGVDVKGERLDPHHMINHVKHTPFAVPISESIAAQGQLEYIFLRKTA